VSLARVSARLATSTFPKLAYHVTRDTTLMNLNVFPAKTPIVWNASLTRESAPNVLLGLRFRTRHAWIVRAIALNATTRANVSSVHRDSSLTILENASNV